MRTRFRFGAIIGVLSGLLACQQDPGLPTGTQPPPSLAISDALHSNGNDHFFFLPPVVSQPHTTGVFDNSLDPVVEICEWASTCGPVIGRFTRRPKGQPGRGQRDQDDDADDPDGNFVVKKAGQHFSIDWDTKRCVNGHCSLDPAKTYRIRILVAGVELGYADVDLVANKAELRNVATNDFIGLINGKSLQVKFRIEVGAIHVVPATGGSAPIVPSEGGTVATADGAATLDIPAGALPASSAPTTISVVPVASSPSDPALVPGTTFEFGPNGIQFSHLVTVRIAYNSAALPIGIPEANLRLFTLTGGVWKLVTTSHVDASTHTVIGELSHFSEYSLGGATPVGNIYVRDPDYSWQVLSTSFAPTELEQGITFEPWIWLRGAGDEGIEGREVQVVSSNPAVISVDSVYPVLPDDPTRMQFDDEKSPNSWLRFTARSIGHAVLLVSSEGVTDSLPLEVVRPAVSRVDWYGPLPTISVAGDLQLSVNVRSAYNQDLSDRVVTWSIENPLVATVSASGVLHGLTGGCTKVSATSEGLESFHTVVTVTPSPPVLAFLGGNPEQIYVVGAPVPGASGCDPRPLIPDATMTQTQPAWSPDGSMLAFSAFRNGGGEGWVGVVNADGSGLRRITPLALDAQGPAWSHDGTRIAFAAHTPPVDHSRIFVVNADGTGLHEVSPDSAGSEFNLPSWSPDDSRLAYGDGRNDDIWLSNADGTGTVHLVCGQSPAWSPNGARLAYLACAGRNLSTIAPDGTNVQVIAQGQIEAFQWSPSGSQFLMVDPSIFAHAVEIVNADGTGRRVLFNNNDVGFATWALDGSALYYAAGNPAPFGNPGPAQFSTWRIARVPVSGTFVETQMATGYSPVPRP